MHRKNGLFSLESDGDAAGWSSPDVRASLLLIILFRSPSEVLHGNSPSLLLLHEDLRLPSLTWKINLKPVFELPVLQSNAPLASEQGFHVNRALGWIITVYVTAEELCPDGLWHPFLGKNHGQIHLFKVLGVLAQIPVVKLSQPEIGSMIQHQSGLGLFLLKLLFSCNVQITLWRLFSLKKNYTTFQMWKEMQLQKVK